MDFDVTVYAESEDPAKHFTMKAIRALTKEELLALVRERLASSARFKNHAFAPEPTRDLRLGLALLAQLDDALAEAGIVGGGAAAGSLRGGSSAGVKVRINEPFTKVGSE